MSDFCRCDNPNLDGEICATCGARRGSGAAVAPARQAGLRATLTAAQMPSTAFEISGALTSNALIIVPNNMPTKVFENLTSGAFAVTIQTAAGTGFILPPAQKYLAYSNGVNAEFVAPSVIYSPSVTPLPAVTAGVALSYNHGLGFVPVEVILETICLTAEFGYSIGDIVTFTSMSNGANWFQIPIWRNTTQVGATTASTMNWIIYAKTGGAATLNAMTAANWSYRFKIRPV